MKKVSVVIIARNEEEGISRCIKSVLKQNYKNKEIIVVDDASSDRTAKIAKKMKARVITNKKNLGIARSFNVGIKASKGDIIVTLHADAELIGKNWITRMVKNLKEDVGGATSNRIPKFEKQPSPTDKVNFYFGGAYETSNKKDTTEIEWLPTRCDIFRKKSLTEINYFNKKLRVSGDCIDLSTKLRKKGYKLILDPKSKALINLSSQQNTFRKILKKRINFGKVIPYLLKQHFSWLITNRTWLITTIPYIAYFWVFILAFFNQIFLILFLLINIILSFRISKITGISSFLAAFVLIPIYTIMWNLGIIYGLFLVNKKII